MPSIWACAAALRQRLPGQILPAYRQRLLGLVVEVVHRVLELLLLQLQLLARSAHRHQGLAHLGELIEHLLVGQVEHFVGLFCGVERLVGLGREYVVGPLEERHADPVLSSTVTAPLLCRKSSRPAPP
jgi:hypothetical protein